MNLFQIALTLSTLLCSLVAGFVFAFAIVVMPGIQNLNDRDFLQTFKVIDRVIQNNQPIFILVWVGSIAVVIASAWLGILQLDGIDRLLIIIASVTYLLGVQLPTITINIPLNNQLQTLDLDSMSEPALQNARKQFEPRWVKWNSIRTVLAILTSVLLILLVFRI